MSFIDTAEGISPKEQESKPKVLATFYGYTHEDWNLQGIAGIRKSLAANLESSQGKNIIFFEFSSVNPVDADLIRKGVKQRGFLKFESYVHLKRRLGRDPTEVEIQKRIDQIASSDPQTIAEEGLIPGNAMQQYFLFQELDELKKQWSFEFETEYHPKLTTEKLTRLREDQDRQIILATEHWDEGKFDESLESYVKASQIISQRSDIREKEIVDYLKGKIKTLLKEPNGGSLFILFGATHSPIIEALRKKLGPKAPIKFNTLSSFSEDSPTKKIYEDLREGRTSPEVIYAQDLLNGMIIANLVKHAIDTKSFSQYANSSETVAKTVEKVVTSLSLEEIRRICEEKLDVLEFLRNHSLAEPIKQFLT